MLKAQGTGFSRFKKTAVCAMLALLLCAPAAARAAAILGEPPEEAPAEKACLALIVSENETGAMLRERQKERSFPASGDFVRLMAALTALDYLNLEDMLVPDAAAAREERYLFEANEPVSVGELLTAMLVYRSAGAARMLAQKAQSAAGVSDLAFLMNQKALALGMEHSLYANAHGAYDPASSTTLYDQLLLARAAFQNEAIDAALRAGRGLEQGSPLARRRYGILREADKAFDARVTAFFTAGEKNSAVICRVQNAVNDMVLLMLYPPLKEKQLFALASDIADEYAETPRLDLTAYIEQELKEISLRGKAGAFSWKLKEKRPFAVSSYFGFTFDPGALNLEADEASLTYTEGGASLTARVFYQGTYLGSLGLAAPPVSAAGADNAQSGAPSERLPDASAPAQKEKSGFFAARGLALFAAIAALSTALVYGGRALARRE